MARPHAVAVELSQADRAVLLGWTRRRKTAQALALRARIVLACADSAATNTAIAEAMGLSLMTVSKWRRRFAQHGVAGLDDAPRSGAPRTVLDEQVEAVITTTLETVPENATHWSTRTLAAHLGLSQTTISRIWRAFALAPHRTEGFKLSTDPYFVDKVRDIVGLYLHPPERALVLCVDEKPSIQAQSDTAPAIPQATGPARAPYARLPATRHDRPLCRLGRQGRHGHRRSPPASSQRGVPPLPADRRACHARGVRTASGARQRQHPQEPDHSALAAQASARAPALHTDFGFLDQPGGVLVLGPHGPASQTRAVSLHSRIGERHPCLRGDQQRESEAIRLDEDRRPDPSVRRSVLHTNF
jgi:transposase